MRKDDANIKMNQMIELWQEFQSNHNLKSFNKDQTFYAFKVIWNQFELHY